GPGLGNPTPPGGGSGTQPVPGVMPTELNDEEKKVLDDVEQEYARYLQQAELHNKRMREVVGREYEERQKELEARYAEQIAKAEADKKARHLETVALLQKFLQQHPNHEQFTPDATFRLADLYLDESDEAVEI